MNLIFDIGNSSTKMALFDGHDLLLSFRTKGLTTKNIQEKILPYRKHINKAIISSTKKIPEFIPDLLSINIPEIILFSHSLKLPFLIDYKNPDKLGSDRIAAIAGAYYELNGNDTLVIDAGSAITIDYLCDKRFIGGNISPGINMRLKALHKYTSCLPLVSITGTSSTPGQSTEEAIEAGVIFGILYEINEYIRTFLIEHPDGNIVLTGGDGEYLREKISFPAKYLPNLLIAGLNFILEDNAK